jgi:hypothetical protein
MKLTLKYIFNEICAHVERIENLPCTFVYCTVHKNNIFKKLAECEIACSYLKMFNKIFVTKTSFGRINRISNSKYI